MSVREKGCHTTVVWLKVVIFLTFAHYVFKTFKNKAKIMMCNM